MSRHCTLHDASYRVALQLDGSRAALLQLLGGMTDPSGLGPPSFGSQLFRAGARQGAAVLHHRGAFPDRPIAPVEFLWRTEPEGGGGARAGGGGGGGLSRLWLWVHAAAVGETLGALRRAVAADGGAGREGAVRVAPLRPPPAESGSAGSAHGVDAADTAADADSDSDSADAALSAAAPPTAAPVARGAGRALGLSRFELRGPLATRVLAKVTALLQTRGVP